MSYLAGGMAAALLFFSNALDEDFIKTKEGPLAVEIADVFAIHDVARKKELPCKAYFPKMGGPYPLILCNRSPENLFSCSVKSVTLLE